MPSAYSNDGGLFQNKLGLTNAHHLSRAEYELAAIRADEILTGAVTLVHSPYGLERLMAIHLHLFQDVYEWAGKLRTVYSSKHSINGLVTRFLPPEAIQTEWEKLELQTQGFVLCNPESEHGFERQLDALVEIFIRANHIHPFPDGNGRSLQVFMASLALEQSIELDYTRVNAQDWNHACALSGDHGRMFEHTHFIAKQANPEPIKNIFAQIATKR